jgi:hypothetical protein
MTTQINIVEVTRWAQDEIKIKKNQAEMLLVKQLRARNNFFHFTNANDIITDIQEICRLFGIDVPHKNSFDNYQRASEKAYKIWESIKRIG